MPMPSKSFDSHRTCVVCKETKEMCEFAKRRRKLKSGEVKEYTKPQCKLCMAKARKEWGKANPDKIRAGNNSANKRACDARRRAKQVSASVLDDCEWNRFVIEELYSLRKVRTEETGICWHIDHIVPLQGKLVSGLHVWYNLQCIPAAINLSKNNSFMI